MNKPSITYPCKWIYTIFGTEELQLRKVVSEILKDKDCSISLSKKSSKGKYISMAVEVSVSNEEERNKLFSLLSKHPAVKTVL